MTKEQLEIKYRDKWINNLLAIRTNKELVPAAVEWFYAHMTEPLPPPRIYYATDPLDAVYINAIILSQEEELKKKYKDKWLDHADLSVDRKSEKIKPFLQNRKFSDVGNIADYGWVAFYDMKDEQGELTDPESCRLFREYRDIYVAAGIHDAIAYDEVFICVEKPVILKHNAENILHAEDGMAIKWASGWGQYYVNNRYVPQAWGDKCFSGELTKEDFLNQENDELRAAAMLYIGSEKLLNILGASLVDFQMIKHSDGYEEPFKLFKTKEKANKLKNEEYAWLQRICSSTGTVFFTPTDPRFTSAIEAAKWHRPDWVPESEPYNWVCQS